MPELLKRKPPSSPPSRLPLSSGARVGVVGGGPAGSFYSISLLQMARRRGLDLELVIYEPRDFHRLAAGSCNMCGGIISESLVQSLASDGVNLPAELIQRRIDSYTLHMDVGTVQIPTPLREKRIAAVHRGSGPRTFRSLNSNSFDGFLLDRAIERGARVVRDRVQSVGWLDDRPELRTRDKRETFDLVVVATGVNAAAVELSGLDAYRAPTTTRAAISEFYLGRSIVKRYLGSSMHVFLLNHPGLEFAAIIPKSDYATVCLLGESIDKTTMPAFLARPEVQACMPPLWRPPTRYCHCTPRLSIGTAVRPFHDRVVFIGDCAVTRLYKDGIGAAYRTAKAAAVTTLFKGVAAEDFERGYLPACRRIVVDNRLGRFVFGVTREIQKRRFARRGVWQIVSKEQRDHRSARRMSSILWDVFTGSASYRSVLLRSLHPAFLLGFSAGMGVGFWDAIRSRKRRPIMTMKTSGVLGQMYKDGEVIYRQGEQGDCMYVIQDGRVEINQRRGDKEYQLAELGSSDFFGEMALFEGETRDATVRAIGDTWVYTLERDTLLRKIHEDPSLAFRMIEQLSYRVRELEEALIRYSQTAS